MSPANDGSSARAQRIQAILDQCVDRLASGESITHDLVIAAHPDLMPELGDELRKLSLIERAQRRARDAGSSSGVASTLKGEAPPRIKDAETIPGYKIVRELHRGGQGIVYEAFQESTRRKVALKVMKEGPFAGAPDQARFDREVHVLGQLNHPNIVTIHDSGSAAGHHYFVMDYVPGQPLDVYMASVQRSVAESLRLFAKICEAVNAAHLRGVIHRDLKPGNIRIDNTGEPQILDFGLAKVAVPGSTGLETGATAAMTMTGQFVGSLPWASPEQAEGAPSKIDLRTDVYSLGVILYHMLTSKFPYDVVGNMRDVIDNILTAEPVRPSTIRGDGGRLARHINDEIETIVLKCLSKERERRYQTAGELARDVDHYLSGEPIEAKRDSTAYMLRKQLRKHKTPITVVAGFMLLLIVSGIALAVQSARVAREAESADEISAFFTDMLATLDPMQLRLFSGLAPEEQMRRVTVGGFERDLSVAEMMRRASGNVGERFAGKPRLEAGAREAIGMTFLSLHLYSQAEEQLRKALRLRGEILGDDHPDTLRSELQLGLSIRESRSGRATEAEPFVRSALEGLRRRFGREDPKTLTAGRVLANVLADLRRCDESERRFSETLELQRGVLGEGHRDTLRTMYDWSVTNLYEGKEAEGARRAREAYELSNRALGPEESITLMSEVLVGAYLARQGQYDTAEKLLRTALEKSRRVLGKDHHHTYFAMRVLGQALMGRDKLAEKEQLFREALEGQRATVGEQHAETCSTAAHLVWLLLAQGRAEEAVEEQEPFVEMLINSRGEDDAATFFAMKLLSRALYGAGRLDEAREYAVRAIAAGKRLVERREAPIADLRHYAWFLLTCQPANLRDAEAALPVAIRAFEEGGGKAPQAVDVLALAYEMTGNHDAALSVLRDFLVPVREDHDERHERVVRRMLALALELLIAHRHVQYQRLCDEITGLEPAQEPDGYGNIVGWVVVLESKLVDQARYAGTEPILRASLQVQEATLLESDWLIFDTMSVLGAALTGQEKFAEAEPLLTEGYEQMDPPPAASIRKQQALERIIKLYETWDTAQPGMGYADQAAEWRAKLPATQPVERLSNP